MTIDLATLPHPDTLPIPSDATVNKLWSPVMVEIADHIGPKLTLELLDRFGGQYVDVPINPTRNPFTAAIGERAAATISYVFGGGMVALPLGTAALRYARRQPVIARVRAGELNLSEAARLLRLHRRQITTIINQTEEGMPAPPSCKD